ncbi:MAG: hypothetical protein ACP6IT_03985 [Candidatus Thorarchaeota archaeon]
MDSLGVIRCPFCGEDLSDHTGSNYTAGDLLFCPVCRAAFRYDPLLGPTTPSGRPLATSEMGRGRSIWSLGKTDCPCTFAELILYCVVPLVIAIVTGTWWLILYP